MKLIAKKPSSFGGKRFYIGDEIPAELVLNPRAQEKMGVLAIVPDDAGAPAPAVDSAKPGSDVTMVTVVIHAEEGDMPLNLAVEDFQTVVDILTATVDEAEPIIAQMTNSDALILLDCVDSRKSIRTAAKERALELNEAEGEQ